MRDPLTPLDAAYDEINALGGVPATAEERIYCAAIGDALAILERHGARFPGDSHTADLVDGLAEVVATVAASRIRHEVAA